MWQTLLPETGMLAALDKAEGEVSRAAIRSELARVEALASPDARRRERAVLRNMRKRWSEQFADACAVMVADAVRANTKSRGLRITPNADGSGRESFTPLGHNKGKRIDVVASKPLVGLQFGISLKGANFADDANGNFDKNLTGRLYEMRDEVSTVHEYLPRAFMMGMYFLPVSACFDKSGAPTSFAHTVAELRARTGRLDHSIGAHNWRCDYAAVCLYSAGDPEETQLALPRGVARYFPVFGSDGEDNDPPRKGLPAFANTVSLAELVDLVFDNILAGTAVAQKDGDAEPGMTMTTPAAAVNAPPLEADGDGDDDDEDAP